MSNDIIRHNRPISDHLHPFVYFAVAALALWFIVSAWGFAGDGYTDWLLVVVSGFISIVVALMLVLSQVGRKKPGLGEPDAHKDSFQHWASGEFVTWQDRAKGKNAAIEILLPLAAVAFGMTAIVIAYHFAAIA